MGDLIKEIFSIVFREIARIWAKETEDKVGRLNLLFGMMFLIPVSIAVIPSPIIDVFRLIFDKPAPAYSFIRPLGALSLFIFFFYLSSRNVPPSQPR